jgi:TonB family protein
VTALKQWKFEPARINGDPVAASSEVAVVFEVQGMTVVSLNATDELMARFYQVNNADAFYRPCALKELDRIPTPLAAPAPAYPQEFARTGRVGRVTISFYIDESGAVRLPTVEVDDNPDLASLAVGALRQWKFEPPTRRGRPVLVKATQIFNFQSPAPAAGAAPRAAG